MHGEHSVLTVGLVNIPAIIREYSSEKSNATCLGTIVEEFPEANASHANQRSQA